jgi:DNA-binding transcriptional LysR family regulator
MGQRAIVASALNNRGDEKMEMTQIRYVLTAARTLNFTRAARECNVSQPALTKAIKSLEAELEAPLFHREGKQIQLSELGRSMLAQFQRIIDGAEAAQSLAESYRLLNQVPIRLGIMSTVGHLRLARFIADFEKQYPGVELAVTEQSLESLASNLEADELDVAVLNPINGVSDRFHTHEMFTERYVVIFPPEHRLANLNAVPLQELSGEPYVDRLACELREMMMATCTERDINLYARFRSDREDWVQAMVLAGIGFAFVPEYAVSLPGLLQRPLVEPEVSRSICLATVPGRPFTPAIATFVRAVKAFSWPG